ncbi:MAG: hypothetical protein IJ812_02345, partial [Schwartzia sp.]|nr:hypothetical protein [Schwartzia sp. (in: firmicutes)]
AAGFQAGKQCREFFFHAFSSFRHAIYWPIKLFEPPQKGFARIQSARAKPPSFSACFAFPHNIIWYAKKICQETASMSIL